ncbi:MAG: FHIPEP family type III secretion protein, partial [Micrococcales bacterium]|nr:FHIPEP family type III secretion protein [Micrococcales bacterium]
TLLEGLRPADGGTQLMVDPSIMEQMLAQLQHAVTKAEASGRPVVLTCAPAIRPALHQLVALALPRLAVLSYPEVTGAGVTVETAGVVSGGRAIAA